MGNCISLSIPLDKGVNKLSQWLEEKLACIHNLEKNLTALEITRVDLKAKQNDLLRSLKREEDRGLQRLDIIHVWLTRVDTLETKVNDILIDKNVQLQMLCLCGSCSKSLISSYRYGKRVILTREVEKLKSEDFEHIAEQAPTSMVEERQLQPTIVGQETIIQKAWEHLMKDEVGIMGIFGMGGVGKTTLLTQIYNKFNKDKCGFDYVIWVVVSQELNIEKIQDEIARKVDLCVDESEKEIRLFNFLRKKRFLLFLDDIWKKVDLAEIGIPDPRTQKGCKVVFTTRSQSVCSHMGVEDPMEVQCLADNAAFDLFQKKVGQVTLGNDPGIPDLARLVAKKCCGLPLALNVIGETMSCKKTIQEWRHAIHVLNSYAAEFSGMDDKILPLLKYSYDNLKGEYVKSCLLYCALFPEDHKIVKEDLIEYWICEGIIDGSKGIENAENEGYDIIGSLVCSSLLMEGDIEAEEAYVHMHDVVREMALWIASDLGKQKEVFIVRTGIGLKDIPKVKNWTVVKRLSLMDNMIHYLVGSRECLELTTLLLQTGMLTNISSEFFESMPKLTVLDLSRNERLCEAPEGISELVSLQYLNLAYTSIYHLPKGLYELKKIIYLNLEYTNMLESIDGISSAKSLQVLKLEGSAFAWDHNTVQEMESLEYLEFLIPSNSLSAGKEFLSSHKLMSCTRSLCLDGMRSSGISLPATMDKLCYFNINESSLYEIKMGRKCSFLNLVKVMVDYGKGLRDLTFLMFAPNLRILHVRYAEVEDIINKEKASEVDNSGILPFQKLKVLELFDLPLLKNIFWIPLPFLCLEVITIERCPNLKKLPLDSRSGKNGIIIKCIEKEWIEGVKWEDEVTKTRFLSSLPKASN